MTKKKAMLINGQFPGPLIRADWGDEIEVTVTNHLRING
jgi:FtsP/CotA-like multicopper oxidase with cupredoxin domain